MKSLLIICIILCIASLTIAENRVVCYWDSFSSRHEGLKGKFTVDDIDPKICTHIIYTYLRFTSSVVIVPDFDEATIKSFINLKNQNSNVKLLIGVGGSRQGTQIPSKIATTATDREEFAVKIKAFIDKYGFDGCDFDWQYPNQGTGSSTLDYENYVKVLAKLREKFSTSKILSVSVAPKQKDINASYNISGIAAQVDFINLNSYGLKGTASDTRTAFHAPYRKKSGTTGEEAEWNAVSIVENWITKAPAEKLTLGIPTYGRSYTLSNIMQTGIGASVTGIGKKSQYLSDTDGLIPYAEICYNVQRNSRWTSYFDDDYFVQYAVFDNQWVSYDFETTVVAKIYLARNNGLGGVNFANIDRDDFLGECNSGKFPLIKAGYDGIVKGELPSNPIDLATTTIASTTPTTTSAKPGVTTLASTTTESTTTTTVPKSPDTESPRPTTTTLRTTVKTSPRTTTTSTPRTTTSSFPTPPLSTMQGDSATMPRTQSTTKQSTTTVRPTETVTDFPTPPTVYKLASSSINSDNEDDETDTTTVAVTEPSTTTTTSVSSTTTTVLPSTIKKTTTKSTTTTHFPTPPVTPRTTTRIPDDAAPVPTARSSIPVDFRCPAANHNYANPESCTTFIICANYIPYLFDCPNNLHYDAENDRCDYPSIANCQLSSTTIADFAPPPVGSEAPSPSIPDGYQCLERNHNYPNPESCTTFIICANFIPYLFDCPNNLHYDAENDRCDYPSIANCQLSSTTIADLAPPPVGSEAPPPSIPDGYQCLEKNHNYPNPGSCTTFIICANYIPYLFTCPNNLHYEAENDRCNSPSLANCSY